MNTYIMEGTKLICLSFYEGANKRWFCYWITIQHNPISLNISFTKIYVSTQIKYIFTSLIRELATRIREWWALPVIETKNVSLLLKDVVWVMLQEVLEKEKIKELQKPSWDQICLFWIGRKLDLRPDLY